MTKRVEMRLKVSPQKEIMMGVVKMPVGVVARGTVFLTFFAFSTLLGIFTSQKLLWKIPVNFNICHPAIGARGAWQPRPTFVITLFTCHLGVALHRETY